MSQTLDSRLIGYHQGTKLVGSRPEPGSFAVNSDDEHVGDLGFVLDNIRVAEGNITSLMQRLRPDQTPTVEEHIGRLKAAYEALSSLEAYLPAVEAWCVMRGVTLGSKDNEPLYSWSIWDGHTTEGQAEAFRKAWEAKENRLGRRMGWSLDKWVVERHKIPLIRIMAPGLDAEKYVAESGAFSGR